MLSKNLKITVVLQAAISLEHDHYRMGHRDCHIKPDLVLIYQKTEEDELLILKLVRLGSHSELEI